VVKQVSDAIVRITGVALPVDGTTGTIGLAGATGTPPDVRLPSSFRPAPYSRGDQVVSLQDSVDASFRLAALGSPLCDPVVIKTGTTEEDFRITLATDLETPSPLLEIYVKFHG
jgi:hypothetical protein